MNTQLTEIAFVLDRSDSLSTVAESAVAGINAFLRDQQAAPGRARFTLVLFDDEFLVPVDARPIAEVAPLDALTDEPRPSAALRDAIGRTVDGLGVRLASTAESERPGKVIVAILTGGHENASRKYTRHDIAGRIRHQREKYGWEFLFLGASQDALATAAAMNIGADSAATFQADAAGVRAGFRSASRKASALRTRAAHPDAAPLADESRPMSEIQADEDRIERGRTP